MISVSEARREMTRKYERNRALWLGSGNPGRITLSLNAPSEEAVLSNLSAIRAWVDSWSAFASIVETRNRRWQRTGTAQTIPEKLVFPTPEAVADFIGKKNEWKRAGARLEELAVLWPACRGAEQALRNILFEYEDVDFSIIRDLICEVTSRSVAGLALRQLNVPGMHTKWPEKHKSLDIKHLFESASGTTIEGDFFEALGIKKPVLRLGVRVLCPDLRRFTGGLRDIEVSLEDLGAMTWKPDRCLLVENDQTFEALSDEPGLVVIKARGNSVSRLAELSWHPRKALYWGDLDTHGFFILNEARRAFPGMGSVLMDEGTLLSHRPFWVNENSQKATSSRAPYSDRLTQEELEVYTRLLDGSYARKLNFVGNVRLEQERISWEYVQSTLKDAWDLHGPALPSDMNV